MDRRQFLRILVASPIVATLPTIATPTPTLTQDRLQEAFDNPKPTLSDVMTIRAWFMADQAMAKRDSRLTTWCIKKGDILFTKEFRPIYGAAKEFVKNGGKI